MLVIKETKNHHAVCAGNDLFAATELRPFAIYTRDAEEPEDLSTVRAKGQGIASNDS
jgi:hypothetical protein